MKFRIEKYNTTYDIKTSLDKLKTQRISRKSG